MARTTTRKSAPKKSVVDSAVAKTVVSKPAVKKAVAKKAPAKKAPAKVAPAKQTAVRKTPAKQTPARKTPAKKTAAKKTTAKKTSARRTGPGRQSTEAAAKKLSVKPGEDPWTTAELAEVRGELETDRTRLRSELNLAEHELHDLMVDAGEGAGNDQADVGSATFERDHEIRIAKNSRDMLDQTERALARIDDGSYGICESCGEPIGKLRVMAFPRATLCLSCKQREERR